MSLNQIILMGRLTRDPEQKNGRDAVIAKFTLAVDRRKKEDPTDFFDCTAFGGTAEVVLGLKQNCSPLKKGDKVVVRGSAHIDNYTDKDGVKRKSFNVTLEGFDYCESKKDGQAPQAAPAPQAGYMPQQGYAPAYGQPAPAGQYVQPQGYAQSPQGQAPIPQGQPPQQYAQPAPAGQPPVGSLNLSAGANGFIPNGQYQ